MKLVGLTGGIGCGKSYLTRHLQSTGVPVIDTDDISRLLLEPGQVALELVKQTFGDDICCSDGSLNRQLLSQIVFNDRSSLKRLENILHPRIREAWESTVSKWEEKGFPLGVVVIPLLFESGIQNRFDSIVALACSAHTQRLRLRSRGWDEAHISKRISSQWTIHDKVHASDFIVWTDTEYSVTDLQWDLIKNRILVN